MYPLCMLFVLKILLYLLYSVMSLSRSSVEILLLSCLKSGENRDSRSTVPWLSLNTDLGKQRHQERNRGTHFAKTIWQLAKDANSIVISQPHRLHSTYPSENVSHFPHCYVLCTIWFAWDKIFTVMSE